MIDAWSASPRDPLDRASQRAAALRRGLALVLVVYLALAGWYTVAIPVWEAPDESEHVQYVYYLLGERRLPSQLPTIQLSRNDESHQAPLYYALAAMFSAWAKPESLVEIRMNPYVTWPNHPARIAGAAHSPVAEAWPFRGAVLFTVVLRLFSSLLGIVTILATFRLVGRLVPAAPELTLLASASVAFLPGFVSLGARVTNDTLITGFGALVALAVFTNRSKSPLPPDQTAGLAVLLMLSVATKLSGLVLVAAVVASRYRRHRSLIVEAAVLAAPALLVAAGWSVFRGGVLKVVGVLEVTEQSIGPAELLKLAGTLLSTFVGAYGRWQYPLPASWTVTAFALTIPPFVAVLAQQQMRELVIRLASWPVLFGLAITAVWVTSGGQEQLDRGRFLYPALAPLAALLALGWAALPRPLGSTLARTTPLALLAITLATPPLIIQPDYAYRSSIAEFVSNAPDPAARPLDLVVAPGVRLIGFNIGPTCPKPGDAVRLQLFWRAEEEARRRAESAVFLVSERWPRTFLSRRDPGRNLYPSDIWLRNEVIRDDHEFWLANDLPIASYDLTVVFAPREMLESRAIPPPVPFAKMLLGSQPSDGCVTPAGITPPVTGGR